MNTKFYIAPILTILLCSCQQKDWTSSNQNDIWEDSVDIPGVNDEMVKRWFALNKEADSIISSSQLFIEQQRKEAEHHPQDEREYIAECITEAQQHLDEMKRKIKYIKEFAGHVEKYDPAVQHKLDSLKEDYIREDVQLRDVLNRLR